jgi:NADH:ubiquinone oxidoreductase subunit 6 (subunit J)
MASFIFMFFDYYFLGLTYIIVYVGAIAILFLFVIMMVSMNELSGETTEPNRIQG